MVNMPATAPRSPRLDTPLSVTEARCMEAYYALLQRLPPEHIGSEEIRRYFREYRDTRPPGNTTVLLALKKSGVPHRKSGKPVGGRARLQDLESPFLPAALRRANRAVKYVNGQSEWRGYGSVYGGVLAVTAAQRYPGASA